ncbi:hypothetical protein [Cupriavidus necator]
MAGTPSAVKALSGVGRHIAKTSRCNGLERALDAIADRYQQQLGGRYLELYAGPMRSGREGWENLSPNARKRPPTSSAFCKRPTKS